MNKKIPKNCSWSTESELKFLKNLGVYSQSSRLELLNGYLAGAKVRAEWGNMDRQKIISIVENEIKILKKWREQC